MVSSKRPNAAARWALLAVVIAAMTMMTLPAYAQVLYGSLTGTVTDESGAVAVGVKVQALNVATNVASTATTNERGLYLFNTLLPGLYDVTIQAPSFKTVVQKGVRIDTNAVRRVDAKLQVSQIAETIEVSAAAVALQTERADVHITQTTRQINELPISGSLGRNYQSLMEVVPGATIQRNESANGEANSTGGSPQRAISVSANGVSGVLNQTRIDGSPANYIWLPTNTAYVPSAEAIEEVSIVTNSYNADVGMAGGAAVNVVVKSGTNKVHGTAWIYDTSSHFTARQVFAPATEGAHRPKNIVAQFGGNIGGPIIKNKLFLFANIERTTQRQGAGSSTASIAPANLRSSGGDIHFPTPAEDPQYGAIIYDPQSNPDPRLRTAFPNNTIPGNRVDPAALYLMSKLPSPTAPGLVSNYTTKAALKYNRTNMDFKLNFAPTSNLTMFARYGNSPHRIEDSYMLGEAGGGSPSGGQVGISPGRTQVFGAGFTYSFNATTMLDGNFGLTHQVLGSQAPDLDVKVGSDPDKMNIPGTNGPDRLQGGIPAMTLTGFSSLGNTGTGSPFQFRDNQYTASLNLQKMAGPHLFRIGAEYQSNQLNHWQPQGGAFQTVRGSFTFSGNATRLEGTAAPKNMNLNSWADFVLGMPTAAGKVDQLVNPNSIWWNVYSAYLQDTWQVTRSLTVMLGVRWEYYPFAYRPNGLGVNRFDPEDGWVYMGGFGNTPQNTYADSGKGRIVPRTGLTYRINDKTVIRGGYGQSVDPQGYYELRNAYPTVNIWSMPVGTLNGVQDNYLPVTTLRKGLVNPGGGIDTSAGKVRLPANTGLTTYPKKANRKYVASWNVTLQRELLSWLTAQAAYVGTHHYGQMSFTNINAGPPGTGDAGRPLNVLGFTSGGANITMVQPYGDTVYNGLQTQLVARANHLTGGLAYTYSKVTNYADNMVGNSAGAGGPRIQYMPEKERNKGLAGYNRTHVLQLYWVWDLPFGKGRTWGQGGLVNTLFGGWQFNGMFSDMTGTPIYVLQGTAPNLLAAGSAQVPDLAGPITINKDVLVKVGSPPAGQEAQYQFFSVNSFQPVTTARFGNNVRNDVPGPNYWNVDLGVFRTFALPGNVKMQLRAEALNALNHPNFRSPGSQGVGGNDVTATSAFGTLTALTGSSPSRNIRFAVRLSF